MVKIGNVELLEAEAEELYRNKKYIVSYNSVYRIMYSAAQNQYYGRKIHQNPQKCGIGYTRRGRFIRIGKNEVQKLIGIELEDY